MTANNKHIVGYIVDETQLNWSIQLSSTPSEIISVRKLQINKETQQYTVDCAQNCSKIGRIRYKIKGYDPIRILVSKKRCVWKITFNCLVLDENNNVVLMMS